MQHGSDREPTCETAGWPGLEAIAAINRKAAAAIIEFNGTLCARMAAINSEWAAFVGKRLSEDIDLSRRLASCRSPEQVLATYGSFLEKALEQYQAEFSHMMKLGQTFAAQNVDLLSESIATARQDAASGARSAARGRSKSADRRQLDSAA